VAQLFRRAAESYGWIVVSSWNTASDGPLEPNIAASRALWADTHARFSLDDDRVYAAGLSGTVRLSCLLALAAPGTVSGVIGASAGYPVGVEPRKGIRSPSSAPTATATSTTTRCATSTAR
jgi:poly(3-hydroxybutyrate) depolymerase